MLALISELTRRVFGYFQVSMVCCSKMNLIASFFFFGINKAQTFLVSDAFIIPVSFVLSHFTGFKACFVYLVCKNKIFSTNLFFIQIFMAQAANLLF